MRKLKAFIVLVVLLVTLTSYAAPNSGLTGKSLALSCTNFVQGKTSDNADVCVLAVNAYVEGWRVGIAKGVLGTLMAEARRHKEEPMTKTFMNNLDAGLDRQLCGIKGVFQDNPYPFVEGLVKFINSRKDVQEGDALVAIQDYILEKYCGQLPRKVFNSMK